MMDKSGKNILLNSAIRLRAVEPADADLLCGIENDSSHWLENGIMAPVSVEFMSVYAATYEPDAVKTGQIRFIVERREDSAAIGVVDIFDIDWSNLHGEVGIYIIGRYRKNSYALQALQTVCGYAGTILGLNALIARIPASNTGSRNLFLKAGFNISGTLRGWLRKGTEFIDVDLLTRYPNEPELPF